MAAGMGDELVADGGVDRGGCWVVGWREDRDRDWDWDWEVKRVGSEGPWII